MTRPALHPHEYSHIQHLSAPGLADELHFSVSTPSGETIPLLGRYEQGSFPEVLLISFMAVWCANCRYEAPLLSDIYKEWSGRGFDAVIVAEYSEAAVWEREFVQGLALQIPYVYGELDAKDESLKETTTHASIHRRMGDDRTWGVPLHILIVGGDLEGVYFVTGEFHPAALEDFLRRQLR